MERLSHCQGQQLLGGRARTRIQICPSPQPTLFPLWVLHPGTPRARTLTTQPAGPNCQDGREERWGGREGGEEQGGGGLATIGVLIKQRQQGLEPQELLSFGACMETSSGGEGGSLREPGQPSDEREGLGKGIKWHRKDKAWELRRHQQM